MIASRFHIKLLEVLKEWEPSIEDDLGCDIFFFLGGGGGVLMRIASK